MTGPRRGQGEGSIYRRSDGRWVAVLDLGWREGSGPASTSMTELESRWHESLLGGWRNTSRGYEFANERLTGEQFLGRWLEAKRGTVTLGTWTRYEELVRLHVNPRIGSVG